MFGQMKSRRSTTPLPPCPCGNVCRCHQPPDSPNFWEVLPIIIGFLVLFGGPLCIGWCMSNYPPEQVRHIRVNGQDCLIHYVTDSCTSTGACSGHDEAVCK
jgi:hypothetical protein